MVLVGTMVSENGGQKQRELEEDPNVCKERGNEEFKNGFWDEALVWYTKAIKNGEKHKDLPVFYKNRAATYLKLENYSKALDDCTKSLEGCPNDPKALFRRFQALEGLERFEESYRDLRAIHTQDPNNKTIKPHLERMHAIVQERSRQRAQTSNKVTQMFQIAFDLAAAKEKREQAMNNIVVLARETAGAEVMMKEGLVHQIGKLLKVEKNNDIVTNAIRAIDQVCTKSEDRTKTVIKELGIPWFLQILDSNLEDRVSVAQHCMQTVLNSFTGMENKDDSKPVKELVEGNKQLIDTLLTCLVYSITERTITGFARDAIMELIIRNVHYKTIDWAERLVEMKGLFRLMEVCSELEEYKYESAMNITPSSRTIATVCLARIYENMYYDAARQRFLEQIEDFVKDKLLTPDHESKVRVTVALTSLLTGPLDVGNSMLSKEGVLQMILAMAQSDVLLEQKVAVECIIAAASKKDKAKGLAQSGAEILKKLYTCKNEEIRVRALVGLCKMGSVGGLDASIRPFADGSTKKLAEACRKFLVKPGKDKDVRKFAAEGLSYLTLDADVKEKLIEDRAAIQGLIELAKTGDQSALYGVVTTLVNLVNAYEKQEILPELVELAKFAKHHIPEEHELDDPDFVSGRIIVLANEGVTSGLVALCKTESENSKEMIARVFNALCSEQEVRGKVVQQGGAKVLLPLSLNGTANGKRHAAQALSRIGITINPEVAFPGQRNLEVVRPLLNQLHPDCNSLENFEALMALCNLASMNESTRQRIIKEQGISKIETYMAEDHLMLQRAATQVMCNMVQSPDVVKMHEKENDRVKFLALLTMEEDEETALASSGALAYLTAVSEKCCEKMFSPNSWMEIFQTLIANPCPEVQYRGMIIVLNVISANKTLAEKICDTELLRMIYGATQLNDEKRAKAIETAHKILKVAEENRLIEENKDADLAPDVFKEQSATIEEIDE
uniref:Protein unc-45 homolog B n=5 Tax=Culex pipiens TaxID=7175 RepID=A0A8D8FVE9_CULPI